MIKQIRELKEARISLALSAQKKEKIKVIATENDCSINEVVNYIINHYLDNVEVK